MLYTITAVSPEIEDFAIELQIESDATFADLHRLIRQTCGWGRFKPATFYLCDERWHRERAIPEESLEDDTMDEIELGDHLDDEGQRLLYLFDPDERRTLLLEVSRIAYGKHIEGPVCRRRHGLAPTLSYKTFTTDAEKHDVSDSTPASLLASLNAAAIAIDDEDDGFEPNDDDLFDMEEIDVEGFDFTEG